MALVGQIAAAIDEATTACVGLTGVVSPDIANEIGDVILVSFTPFPGPGTIDSSSPVTESLCRAERSSGCLQGPVR